MTVFHFCCCNICVPFQQDNYAIILSMAYPERERESEGEKQTETDRERGGEGERKAGLYISI